MNMKAQTGQIRQTKKKKDFTPRTPPVGFVTDGGQWFDVSLIKPTIKNFWLKLLPDGKTIKIKRNSQKLRYQKDFKESVK